jgi:hypothetical protein
MVIRKGLDAIGGSAAWLQAHDAKVEGSYEVPGLEGGDPIARGDFVWITAGSEFRYQVGTGADQVAHLSGHGKPSLRTATSAVALPTEYFQRRLPFHLPGVLLASLLHDPTELLVFEGRDDLGGTPAIRVRADSFRGAAMVQGSEQEWWFNPSSGMPLKVAYVLPTEDGKQHLHMELRFESWKARGDLLLPVLMQDILEGQVIMATNTVKSISINTLPVATLFDVR